jgi:hypothetical protein
MIGVASTSSAKAENAKTITSAHKIIIFFMSSSLD